MKPPKPAASATVDLLAAGWLIKRDRGLSAAEQDEFFQWLAADPRHGESFARQQRTWGDFNRLAQWRPEHSAEPNPDLLARPPGRAHRRAAWLAWTGSLAAAAGIALALVVWSPWKTTSTDFSASERSAATAGYARRVLDDGSVVELNGGARIDVVFSQAERRVRLVNGEANFTVAKNAERPFIVRAGAVDVRAMGTVFNVRLKEKSIEVLVTEGKVRVDDAVRGVSLLAAPAPGETPLLRAGQKVVVAAAPLGVVTALALSPADLAHLHAWRSQLLDFNVRPLGEIIGEFNRANRTQIVLADSALAQLPIVASFRADNAEGFVRLLELTAGVHAERDGDVITLSVAR